jgi:hypothetical protein
MLPAPQKHYWIFTKLESLAKLHLKTVSFRHYPWSKQDFSLLLCSATSFAQSNKFNSGALFHLLNAIH